MPQQKPSFDQLRPKPQENYQVATERAFQALASQSEDQLRWLGAEFRDGSLRLPVLNGHFQVDLPNKVVRSDEGREVGAAWRILALHYLTIDSRPEVLPPSLTFEDLPHARSYGGIYRARVIGRLCATAGRNRETLHESAIATGGQLGETGDVSYLFDIFPKVRVGLVWHAPDEEFPPSATVLLPPNIEDFFCSEDIVVLSEGLVARLSGRPW